MFVSLKSLNYTYTKIFLFKCILYLTSKTSFKVLVFAVDTVDFFNIIKYYMVSTVASEQDGPGYKSKVVQSRSF